MPERILVPDLPVPPTNYTTHRCVRPRVSRLSLVYINYYFHWYGGLYGVRGCEWHEAGCTRLTRFEARVSLSGFLFVRSRLSVCLSLYLRSLCDDQDDVVACYGTIRDCVHCACRTGRSHTLSVR